jgi:predicted  nucleic acid-binding Zn-ribbon protein
VSYKEEYEDLKNRYDALQQTIADIKARKKFAEERVKEVKKQLLAVTKGKDPKEVLEKLQKEIESRMSGVRDAVMSIEAKVEASKLGDTEILADDELDNLMEGD